MAQHLVLADTRTRADLATFISRARSADDGAVHFQSSGTVLAAYVRILGPRALGEPVPTVLGLRTMALAAPATLEVTVSLDSVSDRLARMKADDVVLPVPAVTVTEGWTGVLPPRHGWAEQGQVATGYLEEAARHGIRDIAESVPSSPGAHVVHSVRAAVWGRELAVPAADGAGTQDFRSMRFPAAAAFGAWVLGFLTADGPVRVLASGRWTRLTTPQGHVLVRPAAVL